MLSALVSLVTGYLQARAIAKAGTEAGAYLDKWFRLVASIIVTSYVTLLGTWGATGLMLYTQNLNIWVCLVIGFLSGILATGLIVYTLWTRDPLTKGIAIAIPAELAAKATDQNITVSERN